MISNLKTSRLSLLGRCSALNYIVEIFNVLPATAITSKHSNHFVSVCSLMILPGIFLLRTYAIYGRSRVVFFLLVVPGSGLIASYIVNQLFFVLLQPFNVFDNLQSG